MGNTFKSYQNTSITTETTVFTGPSSTQVTVIGMTIANTSSSVITASVKLNSAYLVKNAPIPVGGTLVPIGGEQKLVVESTDTLSVIASGTVDVITSTLEIS